MFHGGHQHVGVFATRGLLRDDRVTDLAPVTPPLATVMPLDPVADLYLPSLAPGGLDPDAAVVGGSRPLVLYALPGDGTLLLSEAPGDRLRIDF